MTVFFVLIDSVKLIISTELSRLETRTNNTAKNRLPGPYKKSLMISTCLKLLGLSE